MEVSGNIAEARHDLQFCENCQFEKVTTKASGICRECEEYMCDTCFRHHLKSKRHRNHQLIDMNDGDIAAKKIAEDVEKCKQHDNEVIVLYCRNDPDIAAKRSAEQQETDTKTGVGPVFVGARVQAQNETKFELFIQGFQRGTVTAVRKDGTVDVTWDTGKTVSGYRVGTEIKLV